MSEYASNLARRIEAIDTAAADNRRSSEMYQQLTAELKGVRGRAVSPDGAVTVVAGPGGEVLEVAFADQTRRIDPSDLGGLVTRTIAAARAAAGRSQAEVVRAGLGGSELLDRVLEADRRVFGDQPPAEAGSATVRRPQPGYEDDFFAELNVLDDRRRR